MRQNASTNFTLRFQGSDFEQLKFLQQISARSMQGMEDFSWKADVSLGGSLTLITGQYFAEWGLKAGSETPEWLSIVLPRAGALDVPLGQDTIEGLPGQLLLVNNHEAEYFLVRGEPHLSDVLRFVR
jgi:hypothetical protein